MTKIRLNLESLDARIVPDATPIAAPPTMPPADFSTGTPTVYTLPLPLGMSASPSDPLSLLPPPSEPSHDTWGCSP